MGWALDPRNDNGEPNAIHVMAFSYDSDCPNDDDHDSSIIEGPDGFWNVETGWGIEADATEFAQVRADATDERPLVATTTLPEGGSWLHNACRCYDGIYADDVETHEEKDGSIDEAAFGEWGPFFLAWSSDADPGQPRDFTPDEALDAISSRLEAVEGNVHNQGMTMRMSRAVNVLHRFVRDMTDEMPLDWGEPGDCTERIENDPDENDGRHYGVPHCIWCLQAS